MFDFDTYCIENEVWVDVPGYESIYQASNLGRVRTIDGKTTTSVRHGKRIWKGKILKPKGINQKTGYRVSLWKDKASSDVLVARIVCMTFHGVPKEKMTVNHKDGNRFNNHIDNLEWLTLADNIRHGFENGLYPTKSTKLLINGIIHTFYSQSKASLFIGRNIGYISNCVNKGKDAFDIYGNKIQIVGD